MVGIGKFSDNKIATKTANDIKTRDGMDYMESTKDEYLVRNEEGIGKNTAPKQLAGTHKQDIKSGEMKDGFDESEKDFMNGV